MIPKKALQSFFIFQNILKSHIIFVKYIIYDIIKQLKYTIRKEIKMEYVENPMTIGDYPYYQSQEDYEKEMRKQNLEEKIEYLKNEIEIEYDESLRDEYAGFLCLLQEELNYLDSL